MGAWDAVSSIGIGTAIVVAAAWVCRKALQLLFDKEMERFKADLQRAAFEHQVRFSVLHAKQAEVIAETYSRLRGLLDAASEYLTLCSDSPAHPALHAANDRVVTVFDELYSYIRPREIYLPPKARASIREFCSALSSALTAKRLHYRRGEHIAQDDLEAGRAPHDLELVALDKLEQKVIPLFDQLEHAFQELLAVQSAPGDKNAAQEAR